MIDSEQDTVNIQTVNAVFFVFIRVKQKKKKYQEVNINSICLA